MIEISQAKIISFNNENERICSSAARISTTEGNAIEIIKKSDDLQKNRNLIKNVLKSGHKSIIEHAVFTIAFCNVSVYVEQFLIEFRLASFTVKSRRYVNFGKMGYYIPQNMDNDTKKLYINHMDYLFSEYNYLLENNIPKEDARFVLPYSFFSNFYCTVNARELIHILNSMLYGRGKNIEEINNLAKQIVEQLENIAPSILTELKEENLIYQFKDYDGNKSKKEEVQSVVKMIDSPKNPKLSLLVPYNLYHCVNENFIDEIVHSSRNRELEFLNYTFEIKNVSLSGITHFTRHRIQSLIVPPLCNADGYIIPNSIKNNNEVLERYINVFEKTKSVIDELETMNKNILIYLILSGNTLDILLSMNARELLTFFKLRCCERAQWEIRNIAKDMLKCVKNSFPELFNKFGPSCVVNNKCPEGRLSCGRMNEIIEEFRHQ